MTGRERVLVVGHGYAGRRFVRAMRHLTHLGSPLDVVGICDPNPTRHVPDVPCYTDLPSTLDDLQPTVVCVTVNENAHLAVFEHLAAYRASLILTEKPLTSDLRGAQRAAALLAHHTVSMNLVERFSPVIEDYRSWVRDQGSVEVVRIDAFWGKHRIFDPRPTMGVLSELIHPLDLVDHLFLPVELDRLTVSGVCSDLSEDAVPRHDSLDVTAQVGGVAVVLHTSFAWPERMRIVTALVRSRGAGLVRVSFYFDMPHWDCDRLQISQIAADGRWMRLREFATDVGTLPVEIAGVGKLVTYVQRSVAGWRCDGDADGLVDLAGAVRLQSRLELIGAAAAGHTVNARYREAADRGR